MGKKGFDSHSFPHKNQTVIGQEHFRLKIIIIRFRGIEVKSPEQINKMVKETVNEKNTSRKYSSWHAGYTLMA